MKKTKTIKSSIPHPAQIIVIVPTRAREWREALSLTVEQAVDAVCMSPGTGATRWREFETGKRQPTGPILARMESIEAVVEALMLPRSGLPDDARRALHRTLTVPLRRYVRDRVPGAEAVGPRK